MTLSTPEPQSRPITGRKVLWMLLGFFGVMMAVNGIFVYLALSSFSGLETVNAYVKGLDYNATLRRGAAQKALGWQVERERVARGARPIDQAGEGLRERRQARLNERLDPGRVFAAVHHLGMDPASDQRC